MHSCDYCNEEFSDYARVIAVFHGNHDNCVSGNLVHPECLASYKEKYGVVGDCYEEGTLGKHHLE